MNTILEDLKNIENMIRSAQFYLSLIDNSAASSNDHWKQRGWYYSNRIRVLAEIILKTQWNLKQSSIVL